MTKEGGSGSWRDAASGVTSEVEALRERVRELERAAVALDRALDMVLWVAEDGSIVYANPAAGRALGYRLSDMPGMRIESVLRLTGAIGSWAAFWRDSWEHGPVVREAVLRTMGGRDLMVEAGISPVEDSCGRCLFITARDATERVHFEHALVESEERYRCLAESSREGILLLRGPRVIEANQAAGELLGRAPSELVGQDALQLLSEESLRELFRAVRRRETSPVRLTIQRESDGTVRHAEIVLRRSQYLGRRVRVAVVRDITDRLREEEVLREAVRAAELAAETRSQFLANMSHEIRTPLNGVIGMTGLMLDTPLSGEQREYATAIRTSGQALLGIVNEILDFSKIEAGKLDLEVVGFDLRTQVEEALDLLAPKAHGKGLRFTALIPPSVPRLLVGDPARIRQVLVNFLDNAIKFTREGEVVLEIDCPNESKRQATIRFRIFDTGIGIPQEKLARLFDPFTQADSSTTRQFGGTGLGLAISRQLADLMGGAVGAESTAGTGSMFWFQVPLAKQGDDRTTGEMHRQRSLLKKLRVLIGDSHASHRRNLLSLLASWHVYAETVSTVEGLHAAVARSMEVDAEPLDVVFVDSALVGEDLALGAALNDRFGSRAPVLVLMALMGAIPGRERIIASGFADMITKPVKQQSIYQCLVNIADPSDTGTRTQQLQSARPVPRFDLRVLVVEDNPINQTVAIRLLQKFGCRCEAVASGVEAVDAVRQLPYDLVLMDCQMPEMDGFQATRRIRDISGARGRIPIIAMTANAMEGDRERCLGAGMDDYMSKPISVERLLEVLAMWGEDGNSQSGGGAPGQTDANLSEKPVLDLARLHVIAEDDDEFLAELLTSYIADLDARLSELAGALSRGDRKAVKQLAHSIRGASRNVGAERIAARAELLEHGCGDDSSGMLGVHADALEVEAAAVREAVERKLGA